jgi:predicted RNase H-like HicB family nuclease
MTMAHYHINLFWSDEDEAWIADVPDLQYCTAHGASPEAALAEIKEAMAAWLEAARLDGRPAPPPRYRPAIYAVESAA